MHELSVSLYFNKSILAFNMCLCMGGHGTTNSCIFAVSLPHSVCTLRPTKDTEAAVGDVQMPEVDPQIIS